MNVKLPDASVVVVDVWESLAAVIFALEIGAPVSVATTVPLMRPVVPASAHVTWQNIAAHSRTATSTRLVQYRGIR
jgi:hypothetical protein